MNRELATPITASAIRTDSAALLRTTGAMLAGSVLLTVCARVSMPLWFTPVPLSLQPFGVLLLGLLLSPRLAIATIGVYLAEGTAGLPVFAPTAASVGGLGHLIGPTGGYLLAYPLAAVLISALWRRSGHSFAAALTSATLGDLVILVCGALWLAVASHISIWTALSLAAVPFMPGDALKIGAATGAAWAWMRLRR